MDQALILAAIIVMAVIFYSAWNAPPAHFVPISASVGCVGTNCDILPRAAPRQHIYNGAPSWYVYGPQNPPIVSYLRHQMVIANRYASADYMNSLGLGPGPTPPPMS